MATLDSLAQPGISAEVDPTFAAARVSIRPLEYATRFGGRILGHYRAFAQTAAIAPSASGIMGAWRYTDTSSVAVITRIYTTVTVATAVTAQRLDPIVAVIARGYTVRDLTNATVVVLTGNNAKTRTSMGTTLAANMDVASTAAGMTGGTKTQDTNPIGAAALPGLAALGTALATTDLYKWDQLGGHPVVLAANEGINLLWGATSTGTGTVTVGFGIEWAEVPSF